MVVDTFTVHSSFFFFMVQVYIYICSVALSVPLPYSFYLPQATMTSEKDSEFTPHIALDPSSTACGNNLPKFYSPSDIIYAVSYLSGLDQQPLIRIQLRHSKMLSTTSLGKFHTSLLIFTTTPKRCFFNWQNFSRN